MTDWIEHNGGPQPVADDVWVKRRDYQFSFGVARAFRWDTPHRVRYHILNQHLIDAKQAEIDQLRDDLETWQSVFPHVMPDRLKSDQQLAEEDVAAKIDAARMEGIRLGLEAAATHLTEGGWVPEIMALNPETIAQAGLTKPTRSDLPPSSSDTIAREAVLDQLTSEAQADNMGYQND